MCAGAVADTFGVMIWVPMDIVCQRMQAGSMYTAPGSYQGLRFKQNPTSGALIIKDIAKRDGVSGFFRGVGVSMVVQVPCTAVQMAGYEHMKDRICKAWKLPEGHPVVHVAAGAVAGIMATALTHPLDVLKTRMQVDIEAKTVMQVGQELLAAHGWRGFLRGMLPRVCSNAPRSSLSFILYELSMTVASPSWSL